MILLPKKIFPNRDDAKLVEERSLENSPAAVARSEKIFLGFVIHHYSLKIYFGLPDHTVMS